MPNLEVAQLVFSLPLVQHFLTVLPSLPFGIVMSVLCHCILEMYILLFYLDFTGGYSSEIALHLRRF